MTRDQMIDRTRVTQPQRPSIPPATAAGLDWGHVYEISVQGSDMVPVRRFRATDQAGVYAYTGGVEEVWCRPGFKAFEYQPFVYAGDNWSADGLAMLLFQVRGRWYCDIPPFAIMSSAQMALLASHFPIVDARPSPGS